VPQIAEEEFYGFDDLSFAAAPYTARAREIATMMVSAGGMGATLDSRSNYVPTTDQFMIADFLRSDVVEMLLRSTTVEAYFETDREARVMLQKQHALARGFVKRQKAAIDALTDALYERRSVDDEAVRAILKQHAVPEPEDEDESSFVSPENRDRLEPWAGEMPEGSVPATNEWIET
jgi:ATP-dependent Zn protease